MMAKTGGWNLWELDRHHGEAWDRRFQMTLKNPTIKKISNTPNGWAIFRDGIKPMWEDEKNFGRFTARKIQAPEIRAIIESFFNRLADDQSVNGIVYTRSKNFALWVKTTDEGARNKLKKTFSQICNRSDDQINWDTFEQSKQENLHLTDVIWFYGQLSAETETLTNLSFYDVDILEASPNFIINYKRKFPIKCEECFLVETTFRSPFNAGSIKIFVESCFFWFQNSKNQQITGISKAIALKLVDNQITVRFYTDPIRYCKRRDIRFKNPREVLILFAQKWKEQLIQKFHLENGLNISGFRAKDRDLQFTV